jgi:hypothetical protein
MSSVRIPRGSMGTRKSRLHLNDWPCFCVATRWILFGLDSSLRRNDERCSYAVILLIVHIKYLEFRGKPSFAHALKACRHPGAGRDPVGLIAAAQHNINDERYSDFSEILSVITVLAVISQCMRTSDTKLLAGFGPQFLQHFCLP